MVILIYSLLAKRQIDMKYGSIGIDLIRNILSKFLIPINSLLIAWSIIINWMSSALDSLMSSKMGKVSVILGLLISWLAWKTALLWYSIITISIKIHSI